MSWYKKLQTVDLIGIAIIGIGILLRLRQYLFNRSLWVDEASLAVNIINRTFSTLLLPLDYDQGAPIGFLFIEKVITQVFGNHEYALRLFPLISGIISVYLVYLIAKIWFGKRYLLVTIFFSFSDLLIYYSSELKQYSSDVMISLLLIYLALIYLDKKELFIKDIISIAIVGFFAIWISHPAIFVLPCIGLLLVIDKLFKKDYALIYWLAGAGLFWVSAFLATYFISLNELVGNENLQKYWDNNFAPLPTFEHIGWYKNIIVLLLPHLSPSFFSKFIPSINTNFLTQAGLMLFLIGCLSIFIKNKKNSFLVISPLLLAFLASVMRQYPISERFLYFWFPFLLFLIAEGVERIYLIIQKVQPEFAVIVQSLLVLILIWTPIETAYQDFISPHEGEDIKPVLAYVQENLQPNDIVYVHHGSVTPFLYYASKYELNTENTFVAKKSRNFKRFIIDVEELDGENRVWFIFSHVIYCDCEGTSSAERVQAHVELLNSYGKQLDYFQATRASAYLYDLSQ